MFGISFISPEERERRRTEQPADLVENWSPTARDQHELAVARYTPEYLAGEVAICPVCESSSVSLELDVRKHDVAAGTLEALPKGGPIASAVHAKAAKAIRRVRRYAAFEFHLEHRIRHSEREDRENRPNVLCLYETAMLREVARRAPAWLSDAKHERDSLLELVKRNQDAIAEAERNLAAALAPFYPGEQPDAETMQLWTNFATKLGDVFTALDAIDAARAQRCEARGRAVMVARELGVDVSDANANRLTHHTFSGAATRFVRETLRGLQRDGAPLRELLE